MGELAKLGAQLLVGSRAALRVDPKVGRASVELDADLLAGSTDRDVDGVHQAGLLVRQADIVLPTPQSLTGNQGGADGEAQNARRLGELVVVAEDEGLSGERQGRGQEKRTHSAACLLVPA